MKKVFYPLVAVVVLVLSGFSAYKAPELKISDDFSIRFESEDPSGKFEQFSGTIKFDPNDLAGSSFNVTIPVKSINTGTGLKNVHALAKEYFNESDYPNITYKSKKISKTSNGYEVVGTLKIKGVEKEQKIPFTFSNNVFNGKFEVNREDFGIGKNKKVSKILKMTIKVPVSK